MDVHEHLPLTEAACFILLSLAPGPKHGYAVMKEVAALSDGRVVLSTGTLYGALKRMLEDGWIGRVDSRYPDDSGRARKEYRLTRLGRRVLAEETARLSKLATLAKLRAAEAGV